MRIYSNERLRSNKVTEMLSIPSCSSSLHGNNRTRPKMVLRPNEDKEICIKTEREGERESTRNREEWKQGYTSWDERRRKNGKSIKD